MTVSQKAMEAANDAALAWLAKHPKAKATIGLAYHADVTGFIRAVLVGANRTTLERGEEIEADFYRLKSYEWACEASEAKQWIEQALSSELFWRGRKRPGSDVA